MMSWDWTFTIPVFVCLKLVDTKLALTFVITKNRKEKSFGGQKSIVLCPFPINT